MSRGLARFLLLTALLAVALAPAAGAAPRRAAGARVSSWQRAVPAAGAYVVTLGFGSAPRRPGADVLVVLGHGLRRTLDVGRLPAARARLTVRTSSRTLRLRFVARRGDPLPRSVAAAPVAPAPALAPAVQPATIAPAPALSPAPVDAAPSPAPAPAIAAPATPAPAPATRRLLFDDEFDGAAGGLPAGSAWDPQEGYGWGSGQLQSYTGRPENVHLDGAGDLVLTARHEHYTGPDGQPASYTSARLQTLGRFSFTYGRVEARIKPPAGTGLWPAFWMLGDDIETKGWPECGEIDVMETIGSLPRELNGTVHGPQGPWSGDPASDGADWSHGDVFDSPSSLSTGFHVYAAEWTPGAIQLSIDGAVYSTVRKSDLPAGARWTFDHPNHLLLNLAVGGDWPGAPTASTSFPADMLVDWVRVYAPAGT